MRIRSLCNCWRSSGSSTGRALSPPERFSRRHRSSRRTQHRPNQSCPYRRPADWSVDPVITETRGPPNEFAMCCRHSAQRYVIVGACTVHLGPLLVVQAIGAAEDGQRTRGSVRASACSGSSQVGFAIQLTTPQTLNWASLSKYIPSVSSDGTSPLLSVCQGTSARRSQPTSLGWRPEPSKPRRSR